MKASQLCRHMFSGVDTSHASNKQSSMKVDSGVDTGCLCVDTPCPSQKPILKPMTSGVDTGSGMCVDISAKCVDTTQQIKLPGLKAKDLCRHMTHVFLRAQDYELWKIVDKGPTELPEDEDLWTKEQIKKSTLNWSAMNMMQCAIHPKEYSRVSSCKSVKEMWDKLQLIYEGTSEVRETKASILVSEFEMFRMKGGETISEMFARFIFIVNGLRGLGKDYSNSDLVRKILRSFPSAWHTKATIIEDSKNLSTMQLDELIGSLMTYEINFKRNASVITSNKPIALKASSSSKNVIEKPDEADESSDEEEDDELALLTRQFKKFLRKKGKGKFKPSSSNKKVFSKKNDVNKKIETNKKTDIICYECRKLGHMRRECPDLKRKLKNQMFKKTRAMLAT
ncbi:hypothetical protein Taro_001524 [Colocasia esculenta]|uniref:CCHC-type domain-containing protein n=1 Tax=Colocasia esculenta TaxID=4460 RepID=A0A843TDW0_COLES|nr:hypothetical protein [Colocasia esculenta]